MQIVVPMSGFGERFRRAGYRVPKPLIEVDGKPIIGHVVDLFPGETQFVFVCNRDHLDEPGYRMAAILREHCPTGRIVAIDPHKLGPVNAVLQAIDAIDPAEPTLVNYCDFSCSWDYADFKDFVAASGCDGAIPCYTGFHPHMMGSTNYAYVRSERGRVLDIQEKRPYTDRPQSEFASSGSYYFASGALMRDAFERTMARPDLELGGERYVSLAYKPLLEDGRRIAVYELNHFMQWGTPQDLEEYRYWSDAFRRLGDPGREPPPRQRGAVMVPMAGLGSRFAQEGYDRPKPLIEVSGEAMVVQAARDLPEPARRVFVQRRDLPGHALVADTLRARFPDCALVDLERVTDGQARTCLEGLDGIDPQQPLTIGACDNGAVFDPQVLAGLLGEDGGADVLVWVARGYPGAARRPQHYGWVDEADGRVRAVSVKRPLADPARDPIVLGTFSFRRAGDFVAAAQAMIARDGRVNGEFYVDECINDALALGLDCRVFEVSHYLCWGTPDDLRTYEYWQSCFHKWPAHPYRLERDPRVAEDARAGLESRYRMRQPERASW
ncbi:NTP transferase domain-containing protein [Lysobacter sp. BMK333-48F3]|uniref:NTP transferase domain-containing protein n=1 Tax=Lysobacter sp. BMK333-48F3 TaxID=2867962 RepID=UPI001C8CF2AE|nr:NTP transferase domain-containing protein [Lysobacter sp. BMK333-48F3]MBX9400678.1 NTP transferase domain-containing protein [Lysobacter sp. BMK333-48F3]